MKLIELLKEQNPKIIAAVMGSLIVTSGGIIGIKKFRSQSEYIEQSFIMEDEFFNTTPRIKDKERIIVIYKDGGVLTVSETLNSKGEVIDKNKSFTPLSNVVKRDDEVLRSGDTLKNGDVVDEEIIYRDGIPYKRKRIFVDGRFVEAEEEISVAEADRFNRKDLEGEGKVINQDGDIVERLIIGEDGKVKKLIQTYIDGEVVAEEIIALDEVQDGDIVSREIIEENGIKKSIQKVIKDGRVVIEEKILSAIPERLFHTKDVSNELAYRDKADIRSIAARRVGSGRVYVVSDDVAPDYSNLNRDKDYSLHEEPRTLASYPVDLTRVITMDRMIPAVLYTELKSEIASEKVIAVVEQDVLGAHGRKILIPKGSKAIGSYQPVSETGTTRLGINWYRIITPRGINIKFEAELADQEGAAGTTGRVDHRVKDRYSAALLFSSISALAQLSVPVENEQAKAAADAFTQELGSVTAEALRESLNLVPRITIPKGSRIQISPLMDIWFKKSQGGIIEAKIFDQEGGSL